MHLVQVSMVLLSVSSIVKLFTKNRILQQTNTLNSYQKPSNEKKTKIKTDEE